MFTRASLASLAAVLAVAASGATASAAPSPPQRWVLSNADSVPLQYFQGLTHDGGGNLFFVGVFQGGYRTNDALKQLAGRPNVFPLDVAAATGFNHIGDPTYDTAEGGRVLVPLECYVPGKPNGGNTCGMGGVAIVDPATLAWRYWVKLDGIPKAMWAEISPDGERLWTSAGDDLVAYATSDIVAANAATGPAAAGLQPVERLVGAVPPSGVTGAAFVDGRLFLAGEADKTLQIWSVDVTGATPARQELSLPGVAGEPEGIDLFDARGGLLHWLISPNGDNGPATYGAAHSELVSFVPAGEAKLALALTPKKLKAGATGKVTATVTNAYGGRPHPVAGAKVTVGDARGTTNAKGVAKLTLKAPKRGTLKGRATKEKLTAAKATLPVR